MQTNYKSRPELGGELSLPSPNDRPPRHQTISLLQTIFLGNNLDLVGNDKLMVKVLGKTFSIRDRKL
jgi:hypothetical protein